MKPLIRLGGLAVILAAAVFPFVTFQEREAQPYSSVPSPYPQPLSRNERRSPSRVYRHSKIEDVQKDYSFLDSFSQNFEFISFLKGFDNASWNVSSTDKSNVQGRVLLSNGLSAEFIADSESICLSSPNFAADWSYRTDNLGNRHFRKVVLSYDSSLFPDARNAFEFRAEQSGSFSLGSYKIRTGTMSPPLFLNKKLVFSPSGEIPIFVPAMQSSQDYLISIVNSFPAP